MSRKPLTLLSALLLLAPLAARAELQLPLKVNFYGFINAEVEWARARGGATPFPARP